MEYLGQKIIGLDNYLGNNAFSNTVHIMEQLGLILIGEYNRRGADGNYFLVDENGTQIPGSRAYKFLERYDIYHKDGEGSEKNGKNSRNNFNKFFIGERDGEKYIISAQTGKEYKKLWPILANGFIVCSKYGKDDKVNPKKDIDLYNDCGEFVAHCDDLFWKKPTIGERLYYLFKVKEGLCYIYDVKGNALFKYDDFFMFKEGCVFVGIKREKSENGEFVYIEKKGKKVPKLNYYYVEDGCEYLCKAIYRPDDTKFLLIETFDECETIGSSGEIITGNVKIVRNEEGESVKLVKIKRDKGNLGRHRGVGLDGSEYIITKEGIIKKIGDCKN